MICKTASWSKDGKGKYVSEAGDADIKAAAQNTQSFRNSNGHVLSGPEFLTVFDGLTGAAIHTIWYNPDRAMNINATIIIDVNAKLLDIPSIESSLKLRIVLTDLFGDAVVSVDCCVLP